MCLGSRCFPFMGGSNLLLTHLFAYMHCLCLCFRDHSLNCFCCWNRGISYSPSGGFRLEAWISSSEPFSTTGTSSSHSGWHIIDSKPKFSYLSSSTKLSHCLWPYLLPLTIWLRASLSTSCLMHLFYSTLTNKSAKWIRMVIFSLTSLFTSP